jgi:hypothetical protein
MTVTIFFGCIGYHNYSSFSMLNNKTIRGLIIGFHIEDKNNYDRML